MERRRLGSGEVIGPTNKKYHVMSLPQTTPAAMMDLEKEDVVVEEVDGSLFELSSAAMELYKVLKPALNSVCMVYDVPCWGLLEAVE